MLMFYMSFIDDENDRDKFEIIYYSYRKRMLKMAYSVLQNERDSEDVVHEAFIKIARNIKSINDIGSNRTLSYVLKATKNTALDWKSKGNHVIDVFYNEPQISDKDFIEMLDMQNNYKRVVCAIENFNDTYKDVLFYYFVYDMKISQIADVLGRKEATVRQQLARGKKLLAEELSDLRSDYLE